MTPDLPRHHTEPSAPRRPRIFLPALVLLAALLVLPGCALLEEAAGVRRPEVSLESTRVDRLSAEGVDLGLGFTVRNPNSVGVRLDRLDYRLDLGGQRLASGERTEGLVIGASGSSQALLPVSLRWQELADVYRSLRGGGPADYRLEMGFWFDVPVLGAVRVPLETRGSFPRLERPRVEVAGLERTGFTADGVQLELALRLENPNDFPLRLGRFDGAVGLAGAEVARVTEAPRLTVGAGDSEVWRVPVRVSFFEAGRALESALRGGGSVDYRLDGGLAFSVPGSEWLEGGVEMPFDQQGRVSLGR